MGEAGGGEGEDVGIEELVGDGDGFGVGGREGEVGEGGGGEADGGGPHFEKKEAEVGEGGGEEGRREGAGEVPIRRIVEVDYEVGQFF